MASTYGNPVIFAKERGLWNLFAKINFGANGVPTLDANRSKGFCSVVQNAQLLTATTTTGSPTLSAVGSFVGLYPGMALTGAGIPAGTVIQSMNASAQTITMSQNATATGAAVTLNSVGGYQLQFGVQAGVRLDAWNKFLTMNYVWDTAFNQGSPSALGLAPAAPFIFLGGIRTATRTIPQVAANGLIPASNTTDCTVNLICGTGAGANFTVGTPASGEIVRLGFYMGNSTP